MTGWRRSPEDDEADAELREQFMRFACHHDPREPGALQRLIDHPEFRKMFPRARLVTEAVIDFGDGREVDVLLPSGHVLTDTAPRCAYCRGRLPPDAGRCPSCGAPT